MINRRKKQPSRDANARKVINSDRSSAKTIRNANISKQLNCQKQKPKLKKKIPGLGTLTPSRKTK
jgi:hypothetical protein